VPQIQLKPVREYSQSPAETDNEGLIRLSIRNSKYTQGKHGSMKGWSTDLGTKTEKTTQESVNKPGCSRQVFIQSLLQACSIRKPPTFATSLHGFFETKHGHPLKMHFFVNTHITETFVTLQNPENPLSVPCKIKT